MTPELQHHAESTVSISLKGKVSHFYRRKQRPSIFAGKRAQIRVITQDAEAESEEQNHKKMNRMTHTVMEPLHL